MIVHDATGTISGVKERTGQISEKIADWATHVATLSPEYVKCAAREEPANSVRKRWVGESDLYSRLTVDDYIFFLKKEPGGWVVQRNLWSVPGSDRKTLCNILGGMPILCPRFAAAAQLAEACHPTPLAVLQWRTDHSYLNRALRTGSEQQEQLYQH